jgi:dethiobiotin synthetase
MSAVFITSTGTDVGKTFVACGLIRHIHDQERMVDAVKPVVSGFLPRKAATSDPGLLLTALGRSATMAEIARISPWRFAAPLSPDLAAQKEDRQIDFEALVAFSRQAIKAAPGVLLIEGVGGVMVPLDDRHTVLDWMSALTIPVIIVVGNYLGTISHTLTALDVVAGRKLEVLGVVVSDTARTASLEDNARVIRRFAGGPQVQTLPKLPRNSFRHPTFVELARRVLSGG